MKETKRSKMDSPHMEQCLEQRARKEIEKDLLRSEQKEAIVQARAIDVSKGRQHERERDRRESSERRRDVIEHL